MKSPLPLLAVCFAALGVSLAAGPQNPPPVPVPPPVPPAVQGRGIVGGAPVAPGVQTGRASVPPTPLVTNSLIVGRVVDAATGKGVAGVVVALQGGPARINTPQQPGMPPTPPAPPPQPPQVLTDYEGRFAFMNLTRGNYTINATKAGYSPGAYGRLRPNGPTRPLQLDDGEKVPDATIRIFKFASISGMVMDESGEPVVATTVRVYRRALMGGRRVLQPAGNQAQTDDRGMYRIANLTPGDYALVVPVVPVTVPAAMQSQANRLNLQMTSQNLMSSGLAPGAGGQVIGPDSRFLLQRNSGMSGDVTAAADATGRVTGFSTVYFPNSPTASGAEIISLGSGEERTGIAIPLRRVPTVAVSGAITSSAGPAADYAIRLIRSDTGDIMQEPEGALAMSDATGSFMFLAVPSGQYVIQAVRVPRQEQIVVDTPRPVPAPTMINGQMVMAMPPSVQTSQVTEPLLWANVPVSVGDADVHGISLTLREGLTVSGRLDFVGSRPRPEMARLASLPVVIEAADGRYSQFNSGPTSRVQADGRFVTAGQLPGKYFIRIGGSVAGWYLQSITANGVDVTDAPVDLSTASVSNVTITFTDVMQDVRGTVVGSPADADPPSIIIFPSDSNAWKNYGVNPTRMKMTRASANGQFGFGTLPPGDYFAAAIPTDYVGEWQDPAYLEMLSRTAQRFGLIPGEKKALDLPIQDVKPPSIGRIPSPVPEAPAVDLERPHGPMVIDEAPQQVRDTRGMPKATTGGSISGTVTLGEGSGVPARFARVSVRTGSVPGERSALTDNEGKYVIAGLPPGSYQVWVTKPAYLTMYYGARRPVVTLGTPVQVDAGKPVNGIDMTLHRGGVVTGVVVGADGEPAPNVRVQLMQRTVTDGEARLTGAPVNGQQVTDDHGVFRLYGLRPGTYAFLATPPTAGLNDIRQLSDQEMRTALAAVAGAKAPTATGRVLAPALASQAPAQVLAGRPVGYSPVYYPGTTSEVDAGLFTLAAGQEHRISVSLQWVQTSRVEGTVSTAEGQPVPMNGASMQLQRTSGTSTISTPVRLTEPGKFLAVGVPPGRYMLTARWTPQNAPGANPQPQVVPGGGQWFAQQEIDVTGGDLSGISLTLGPPLTFTGRVVFDGAPPPTDAQISVQLQQTGRFPTGSWGRTLKPGETEFTITNVTPGRYRLTANVSPVQNAGGGVFVPSPWSVRSATVDGRDAYESSFELQAGRAPTAVAVTLTTRLPQLSATITDQSGKNVPNMIFVLFSANREHWTGTTSRRIRSSNRPGDDGVYQFNSIIPGDYLLAVLTELEPNDQFDPAFLDQLVPSAIKITLAEGDKKVQNLRIAGK